MVSALNKFAYRLLMVQNLVPAVAGEGWSSLSGEAVSVSLIRNGGLQRILADFSSTPCSSRSRDPRVIARDPDGLAQRPAPRQNESNLDR